MVRALNERRILIPEHHTGIPSPPQQEEDHVPKDCGPIENLRGREEVGGLHVSGDHQEGDCHVSGTGTPQHATRGVQHVACFHKLFPNGLILCVRAMMMTACDLSAITKPWEVQSKVSYAM